MNVLQINDTDLPGRRFNGYDLNSALRARGHRATQAVFEKQSGEANVYPLTTDLNFRGRVIQLEQKYSIHDVLLPYGGLLPERSYFREADIVHYHLIHNHLLSLFDLPMLTQAKPTVWTWHDPWAVTGHCVHPRGCQGWRSGCDPCPDLKDNFPLKEDRAGELWLIKREVYQQMDADIVVSSDFMLDFARNSPLGQCFPRIHKIPFGIQLDDFGTHSRKEARLRLSISENAFVVAFRCEDNLYKGTEYIYSALRRLSDPANTVLLCIGSSLLPRHLSKRFHTVELGWQNDTQVLADFYSACDVFLMPSIAESFGLMAVEAMASARPVICFEGTALPSVTHAPDCGIAVPKGDDAALLAAIQRLRKNPEEARRRGDAGRLLAEEQYRFECYVDRHEELYQEILERWRSRNGSQN